MDFPLSRTKKKNGLPGRVLDVRAHRSLATLVSRVRRGDLVVIDQMDLDGETARALVERGPYAVLNAAAFISGRYPNLGPQVLADAGILMLQARREQALALRDGSRVRLHDGTLYDGAVVMLDVEELTPAQVHDQRQRAESGLAVQLESFAHSAGELLHREAGLLLHGTGLPSLRTDLADRVVVVVGPGAREEELRRLRRFLRRTRPVLIGVDGGLDLMHERGLRPAIGVVGGTAVVADRSLRRCREVVLAGPRAETARQLTSQLEKVNLPVTAIDTSTAPVDFAMLLARHSRARVVVPVGSPGTLEEFIDRDRNDQASNVLTRLRLGAGALDGTAVATTLRLAGRRRRNLIAGALAVAVVVVVGLTPLGRPARHAVHDRLPDSWTNAAAQRHDRSELAAQDRRIADLERTTRSDAAYAEATSRAVVAGSLTGRAVSLVVLPGADPKDVAALQTLITVAGGHLTGGITVLPQAAASSSSGLLDALTSQMLTQAPEVTVPGGADEYQRFGALLARAAGLPSSAHLQQAPYDAHAVAIASGLKAAGLVSPSVSARAALSLIVVPGAGAASGTWAEVATAYAAAVPAVIAGPGPGVVDAARSRGSKAYSTVRGTGTTAERVVTVLALAARTHGTVGNYGVGGELPPHP